ncbi:MAG: hypothetical protein C0515_12125, partial [Novosphingobium sp.]|nr:hypothetical protein [Novosphingobium sp.]
MGLTPPLMLSRRRFSQGALAAAGAAAWSVPALAAESGEDARLMALFADIVRKEDALDPLTAIYKGGAANVAAFRLLFTGAQVRARRSVVQS